jgi:GNAT superfamily N-acetyltransferase
LIVRDAIVGDARAIAEVHLASWKTTYPGLIPQEYIDGLRVEDGAARWTSWLEAGNATVMVAEDAAGVFGFAAGGAPLHPVEGFAGELSAIYLLATHQGHGAGRALVRRVARELETQGIRSLLVWALRDNPACGFYERLGGVRVADKMIEIGGVLLPEVAFGWGDIGVLCQTGRRAGNVSEPELR